jgi:hypothetical protein
LIYEGYKGGKDRLFFTYNTYIGFTHLFLLYNISLLSILFNKNSKYSAAKLDFIFFTICLGIVARMAIKFIYRDKHKMSYSYVLELEKVYGKKIGRLVPRIAIIAIFAFIIFYPPLVYLILVSTSKGHGPHHVTVE